MKKILSFLIAAIWLTTAMAGEINYFNKSWAEIKTKAKAEHKYIFIDCYTDWCGWCKVMDKETMVDDGVITLVGDKFIAVKMDMEHGEGVKLAMKYHINAYPTFMFFNPDGDYVYQSMGYQKKDEFTKELNNALDESKQTKAPGFGRNVDIAYPEFYKKAFAENGKKEFPKAAEVNAFLDKQKDLFSEVSWAVIARFEVNDKYTKIFLDNIGKYKSLYGKGTVDSKLSSLLNKKLMAANKSKSTAALDTVLQMVDKYITDDPGSTKQSFRMSFYKETGNWLKYADAISEYIAKKGTDNSNYINSICWSLYEKCDNNEVLRKACGWMGEVIKKEPKYMFLDTYAAVLYKSGQPSEAEEYANQAIAAGKVAGDDTKATQELINKIKSGK